mgnify:CR=1 FL=1
MEITNQNIIEDWVYLNKSLKEVTDKYKVSKKYVLKICKNREIRVKEKEDIIEDYTINNLRENEILQKFHINAFMIDERQCVLTVEEVVYAFIRSLKIGVLTVVEVVYAFTREEKVLV